MTISVTSLDAAAVALQSGDPVIFPTDTVYGLGVAVDYADSPARLYELKGRVPDKPVAWLVGSPDAITTYGQDVPAYAMALARRFWPGPLTLIVPAAARVPAVYASQSGTLGMRMPNNGTALELIRRVGCPVATTSANPSGAAPVFALEHLDPALAHAAAAVVTDDALATGLASTVLDCTGLAPVILREGSITAADVAAAY